jgi:hypothetical protein
VTVGMAKITALKAFVCDVKNKTYMGCVLRDIAISGSSPI